VFQKQEKKNLPALLFSIPVYRINRIFSSVIYSPLLEHLHLRVVVLHIMTLTSELVYELISLIALRYRGVRQTPGEMVQALVVIPHRPGLYVTGGIHLIPSSAVPDYYYCFPLHSRLA